MKPYHTTPVADLHRAFGHPVRVTPTMPDLETRRLRLRLIAEELTELASAFGLEIMVHRVNTDKHPTMPKGEYSISLWEDGEITPSLVDAADATGDLRVVVLGTDLVCGFPSDAIDAEIHRSNMSKLGADGRPILREDGKFLKGPNYQPPNIAGILDRAAAGESLDV